MSTIIRKSKNYSDLFLSFFDGKVKSERRDKLLNQVVLVGRLCRQPEMKESESGKKRTYITLAVPRSFKNADGEYETDFFDCILWDNVATSTVEYCHKGDIVGVKGRLQSRVIEDKENKYNSISVVAEKVTFLTSKSKEQ